MKINGPSKGDRIKFSVIQPLPFKRRLMCFLNSTLLTENCTFITQGFFPNGQPHFSSYERMRY
jgi:hypothetical protein